MNHFTQAIVRPPAANFADGLTTVSLGVPDVALALEQHAAYCAALQQLGLRLTELPPDGAHPDSTFVEDTAMVFPDGALITRPGADSREGEVVAMAQALAPLLPIQARIEAPGTLDAGDVCEAGDEVFIGISLRTNEAGAAQLAHWLASHGKRATNIDIRHLTEILHLKSGLVALGGGRVVAIDALASHPALAGYEVVRVSPEEAYAANCVDVNGTVLLARGFPKLAASLRALGYPLLELDMSEFRKMDGGLSCLSLRW